MSISIIIINKLQLALNKLHVVLKHSNDGKLCAGIMLLEVEDVGLWREFVNDFYCRLC